MRCLNGGVAVVDLIEEVVVANSSLFSLPLFPPAHTRYRPLLHAHSHTCIMAAQADGTSGHNFPQHNVCNRLFSFFISFLSFSFSSSSFFFLFVCLFVCWFVCWLVDDCSLNCSVSRSQTNPTTLSRFIMEEEERDSGQRADLAFILNSISVATKVCLQADEIT